jgi:hypothetical protein
VIVLTGHPDAPFVRRLAAELVLFGYRVDVQERSAATADANELLPSSSAAALVAVDPGEGTAEILVRSPSSGNTQTEAEHLDPRRPPETNAAVLAERFRARLTELGILPTEESSARPIQHPDVSGSPPAGPGPSPRRVWVAAALGVSGGGLGLQPDVMLELRAFPARIVSASAFGRLTLKPASVDASEASADVRFISVGLALDAHPVRTRAFSLATGVSLALVHAGMSGRAARQGWEPREDSVLVPAGTLDARVASEIAPNVSAELRGFFGACAPRIGVHFAGHSVADYGQPLFGGSLGLAFGVF